MMWVIPAATAAIGAYSAEQKREQAIKDRQAQAEVARWSPWTGMAPQQVGLGRSTLEGGIEGGISGAGFAQGLKESDSVIAKNKATTGAESADLTTPPPETNYRPAAQGQMPYEGQNSSQEDPAVLQARKNKTYWGY